jgi:hypothetical protein
MATKTSNGTGTVPLKNQAKGKLTGTVPLKNPTKGKKGQLTVKIN